MRLSELLWIVMSILVSKSGLRLRLQVQIKVATPNMATLMQEGDLLFRNNLQPKIWFSTYQRESTLRSAQTESGYRWREGTQISGRSQNPPADTLAPLYNTSNPDQGYVVWNDEPGASHCPGGCTSFILGHSKGVLGMSSTGGFWLSHSVPKYPDSPADAAFSGIQVGQLLNGQNFACFTLPPEGLDRAGELLQVANLNIFSPHTLPAHLQSMYPSIYKLASEALGPSGPVEAKVAIANGTLSTLGGQHLTVFVKSSTGDDGDQVRMWEDVVEPGLHAGMYVQSWPEGRTKDFPSYCGPPDSDFQSLIISSISIPGTNLTWTTRTPGRYHDHSKWAVTASDAEKGVFCVGDNNRAVHQNFRGGTAICFTGNPDLHKTMASIVTAISPCSSTQERLDAVQVVHLTSTLRAANQLQGCC